MNESNFSGRYWSKQELSELLKCPIEEVKNELRKLGRFRYEDAVFGRELVIDHDGTRILYLIREGAIKPTQQGRLF